MRKRTLVLSALVVAVAVPAFASAAMSPVVSAKLTGKTEIPAGDANGSGIVVLHLSATKGEACWDFAKVKSIGKPTAAHIHKGKAGKAGPVVIPLGAAYKTKGCMKAPKSIAVAIEENPNTFYVNVHNAAYPSGAIRGQLVAGMLG